MSNMWLLGQMRQPGRSLYSDLTKETFTNFVEILLSKKNFIFRRELPDKTLAGPDWKDCLEYEFPLRKETCRLTREQGIGIQSALHTALSDPQHRMELWITFFTIANARTERDNEMKNELAEVRKELSQLRNQRSPFTRAGSNKVLAIKDARVLQNVLKQSVQGKGGKPPRQLRTCSKVQVEQRRTSTLRARTFCHSSRFTRARSTSFTPTPRLLPASAGVSNGMLAEMLQKCTRKHICIGCGKANVGYDSCGCLQTRVA